MTMPAPRDSEWATRKLLVDKRLRSAGWRVVPFEEGKPLSSFDGCAVEEFATSNGPADYALLLGGKVVGVVEAKKLTLGPQNVLSQAARYAKGVHEDGWRWGEFGVPFLFSTNGEVIWHHDVRDERNRSRRLEHFYTPLGVEEALGRDFEAACRQLSLIPNDNARLRPYQREANGAIEESD